MKFYIAGKLENADNVRRVRDALVAAGHVITYDWTVHGNVRIADDEAVTLADVERIYDVAQAEIDGVLDAEVVVAMLPGGRGTHVEIGIGIGAGRSIVFHCEPEHRPVLGFGQESSTFYQARRSVKMIGSVDQLIAFLLARYAC